MRAGRASPRIFHEQVLGALRATTITSSTRFSWFAVPCAGLSRALVTALGPEVARGHLVAMLTTRLYTDVYCSGIARPMKHRLVSRSPTSNGSAFTMALSGANEGRGHWEDGWSVTQITDDDVSVNREGLEMRVARDARWLSDVDSMVPGAQARVLFPKESFGWSPGFYVALSNAPLSEAPASRTARLYWNLRPAGAAPFVRSATRALNAADVRFRLKVLDDPSRFDRCDAGVLYVQGEDLAALSPLIGEIHAVVRTHLKVLTPAFARPIAAGVGYADDPGGGQSFGAHRSNLLAEGIVRAHERGATSIEARLDSVRQRFLDEGIDLDAPFTSRGVPAPEIELARTARPAVLARDEDRRADDHEQPTFLNVSNEIGRRIVHQAMWHRGRCNWLGAISGDGASADHAVEGSSASLGPELYSGASGIALFLAELGQVTGDTDVRATAIGAMRQALVRSSGIPVRARSGLYTGWIGVALAGMRVGQLVDDPFVIERATQLARRATRAFRSDMGFDVISGRSGAIVGLLTLRQLVGDEALLDRAAELGHALIESADVTRRGRSWKAPSAAATNNLTGLSHGAAGAAWALLELAAATGDGRYRAAGESAFRYERSFYDEREGNWPDFRTGISRSRPKRSWAFSCTWCHGAPGIALSRLRGYELFHDETMMREALVALSTTGQSVEQDLSTGTANFSLCHGLAGNAEVLSFGQRALGPGVFDAEALVRGVARAGVEVCGGSAEQWPCGTPGGETPDLMLGLAGIGHFYLRRHDPCIASPLLLHPGSFRPTDALGSVSEQETTEANRLVADRFGPVVPSDPQP
jgi:Lanthionine synthetase C-like protein/HopA1 effector protein family